MRKVFLYSMMAVMLLTGMSVKALPVEAKITVGSKTSDGMIISRNNDLITFRQKGMAGNVSYPADAIKEVVFPVKVDGVAVNNMMQNRLYEELTVTLEAALKPFMEYSDLPSNLVQYQGVLMELYYKIGNFNKSLEYSSKLSKDDRDPALQRKSLIFQGLALIESGRIAEAEALFNAQGWNEDLSDDAPAEDLYITAKFMAMKKDYIKAMETVSKVIAFHSQDPDWMQPSELLCAKIYTEMAEANQDSNYLDSADEVIREIGLLYKDSDEAEEARKLKIKVDDLRSEIKADQ